MTMEESASSADRYRESDVEEAVIGHGEVEGPFTEVDGLAIERDPDYPIRVTVQFYKATSNGVVSPGDMADIAGQIRRVYDDADYVGSLVLDGDTGRPTEYFGSKNEPPGWWDAFWAKHEEDTGMTKDDTMNLLLDLFGPSYIVPDDQDMFRTHIDQLETE
jgi:hypothetical protein